MGRTGKGNGTSQGFGLKSRFHCQCHALAYFAVASYEGGQHLLRLALRYAHKEY